MKIKMCKVKSEARSWDDLINFAKAKIVELQTALKDFEQQKKLGKPCPISATRN